MKRSEATGLVVIAVLCLGAGACEGDAETVGGATTTAPPNLAPEWTDAPATIALGQGQSRRVPFTVEEPEGNAWTAAVDAPAGIEASLVDDQTALVVHTDYDVVGTVQLGVSLEDEHGESWQGSVPIEVEELRWHERQTWSGSEGPEAREHGAVIVDEQADIAVLIGGSGYSPYLDPLDDVWRYDLSAGTWTQLTPSGDVPAGGGSRRVAPIPGTTMAYLFGGYGENGASNDELYRIDIAGGEAAFAEIPQVDQPSPRALHAFVYDPATERFFLFGGVGMSVRGDTWMMSLDGDTAQWNELALDPSPSPRYGFFYGFDAELGRLVIYSGAQGTSSIDPAHDTWVLDVRAEPPAWQLVHDGAGGPPGRRNGCMVFDPSGPRLFVLGGTADAQTTSPGLWALDARPGKESWTELVLEGEPPLRSSGFGLYDASRERVLLGFGNTTTSVYRDWTPLGY